jgi:hypothetical protein
MRLPWGGGRLWQVSQLLINPGYTGTITLNSPLYVDILL